MDSILDTIWENKEISTKRFTCNPFYLNTAYQQCIQHCYQFPQWITQVNPTLPYIDTIGRWYKSAPYTILFISWPPQRNNLTMEGCKFLFSMFCAQLEVCPVNGDFFHGTSISGTESVFFIFARQVVLC